MAQGEDIIPIPGSTNIGRVKENLGSLSIQLSKQEEQEIREASEKAEVHGERYPAAFTGHLFADTPEE
jgi:aryl-alcohol dehydrogenase-like predicted oxidoreductase